jgi:hypothetical protein
MEPDCEFRLGTSSDGLTLRIRGRPYAGASQDPWDQDALTVEVEAHATPFRGLFKTTLWIREFRKLRDDLARLSQTLSPSDNVAFDPLEHAVQLDFRIDQLGHVLVHVLLRPEDATGAMLEYELSLDQSYLPGLVSQLDALLEQYPPALES